MSKSNLKRQLILGITLVSAIGGLLFGYDWVTNRPLALVFEGKVGKGKILISGINMTTDLDKRPEAQQLLFSLKKYMTGEKFNPKIEFDTTLLNRLIN